MLFRSTNGKFVHYGGDVLSNTDDSSHGVQLTGGSTGGIVQAAGDEANITLRVRGVGTGQTILGTTGAIVTLNSTGTQIGERSTTALAYFQRYRIDWTIPALSSAGAAGASADSTVTVTGLTTNSVLLFGQTQVWNSTTDPGVLVTVRCSTAAELKITSHNIGPSTLSGSTKSGTLIQFGF